MIKNILLTEEGRIGGVSDKEFSQPGGVDFDFPEDFDFERAMDWKLMDGELMHDPLPVPVPPVDPIQQRQEELEAAVLELAEIIAGGDA